MRASGPLKVLILLLTLGAAQSAEAQSTTQPTGGRQDAVEALGDAVNEVLGDEATQDLAPPLRVVLIFTAMTLIPALLMTMTSFTRIIIVLSFARRAMAVQEMPPNQVMVGLALFLTVVIMQPVASKIHEDALGPWLDEEVSVGVAADKASEHLGGWLLAQTRENDLLLMVELTGIEKPETPQDVPLRILIPAFALSELRLAFQMGFLIYLPFLVVDLIVASILLSMGMFMLPPIIISTPFKVLLFILVDGWNLIVSSLVHSFHPG